MPWNFSGSGRSDFDEQPHARTLTDSSPVLVLNSVPVAPTMSPRSQCLKASCASAPTSSMSRRAGCGRSCPGASRSTPCPSRASASCGRRRRREPASARAPRSPSRRSARAGRRRARRGGSRSGTPGRAARSAASLARRSAMIWFSSCGGDPAEARLCSSRSLSSRHRHTPCFRLAAMKSSRSPSSTACVLPTS